MEQWLTPAVLLVIAGFLWRAASLLSQIRTQLEGAIKTVASHDTKIDSLEQEVAQLKGRIFYGQA